MSLPLHSDFLKEKWQPALPLSPPFLAPTKVRLIAGTNRELAPNDSAHINLVIE
jgi:hypothetical protein